MRKSTPFVAICLAFLVVLGGCSAGSPTTSSVPPPTTAAGNASLRSLSLGDAQGTPTPAASPSPSPVPLGGIGISETPGSCALGYGDPDASCAKRSPQLLADLEATLDALVLAQPQLFDTTSEVGPGGYKVRDEPALESAVVSGMAARGYCAEVHDGDLQVKNSNDFSETYTLVRSSSHLLRGSGYHNTCTPANFPLNPSEVIKRIRIGFYEMRCADGTSRPPSATSIYYDCRGTLTASPKDRNDDDVPAYIHGPDITWETQSGEGQTVLVEEYPGVAFNKYVTGIDHGEFRICASVAGVKSCMNGQVN